MLPDFFVVGAPKCGTTALASYLGSHPQVFLCDPKEPHFFADDFARHREIGDRDAYERLFSGAGPQHRAVGEASVWYLYSRCAIPNILQARPDARLVVMLRNPVELVQSLHAQMRLSLYEDQPDFERAWRLQEQRAMSEAVPAACREPAFLQYRRAALLADQLARVDQHFPRERILTLLLEDLAADPLGEYRRVLEFLGLPDDGRRDFDVVNASAVHRSRRLAGVAAATPRWALRARRWLDAAGASRIKPTRWIAWLNRREQPRPLLDPRFRRELQQVFADQVTRLEERLERDLSAWRR